MTEDSARVVEFSKSASSHAVYHPGSPHARRSELLRAAAVCVAPIVSGIGLGLSFSEPAMRFLAWFALVPFAWTLIVKRQRGLYVGVFAGAVICHLMGLEFVRDAYSGRVSYAWVTLSVVAACPWVASTLVGRAILRRFVLPMAFVLPVVWVTMEFVRMHFIALFTEVLFPYMQLGTVVVESSHLIQIADLGGVWAVTWLVAAVNGAIFDVSRALCGRRHDSTIVRNAVIGAGAACALVAATWLYGAWRLSQASSRPGPVVVLVPGNLRMPLDPSGAEKLRGHIRQVLGGTRPALLVWSEGACPLPIVTEHQSLGDGRGETISGSIRPSSSEEEGTVALENLSRDLGCAVLAGCDRHEMVRGDPIMRRYNSLALAAPDGGFQDCYDKIYLVPWREFQPIVATNLGLLPAPPSHPSYAGPFRRGNRYSTFTLADGDTTYKFACSICFEISYATLHRRLAAELGRDAPAFFVGVANESAFGGPLYGQVSADAQRLRAIECRRAFVRIAQNGISRFVDGNGQVLATQYTTTDSEILAQVVPIDDRFSLYVAWGNWLPMLSCLIAGVLTAVTMLRTRPLRAAPHDAA